MSTCLLLPFTHRVDMRAIEQALLFAKDQNAILIPLALIHFPEKQSARLEHIQQSKDFLETVKYKAIRYNVPIERYEVFTPDIVGSINAITQEMECQGILLFVRDGKGILLNANEIIHILETAPSTIYLIHLLSHPNERLTKLLFNRFAKRLFRRHKQQDELLEVQDYSD